MPEIPQFNEQNDGLGEKPTPPPLDKNQKIAAASLAVFAVLIIVLWTAQLRNNIYGPFNSRSGGTQVASQSENSDAALKAKDTDGDGLSDYDELNIHGTSPYLADTDSDGFKDGEEVASGNDPNCPQGRTCAGGSLIEESGGADTTASDTLNSLLNQYGAAGQPAQANPAAGLDASQLNALQNLDPASLRTLLLQNGMDKATLDQISDTDLMQSFQQMMSGQ